MPDAVGVDHDDVAAGERVVDRGGLVRVELVDAASAKRRAEPRIEDVGPGRQLRGLRGQTTHGSHPAIGRVQTFGEAASREPIEGCR